MNKITVFLALTFLLAVGCSKEIQPVQEMSSLNEAEQMSSLRLTSPSFQNNGNIPDKYTCKGENINPELNIDGIPEHTVSLALIVDDPDAPAGTWDHWILFNIPLTGKIEENTVPDGAIQGKNSWGTNEYRGPCPPSGTHRYLFKVYALDSSLDLDSNAKRSGLEDAMEGHILAQATLTGLRSK